MTYDRSVGLSHRTGQITHHIGADIDAERDGLFADLGRGGWLTEEFQVTGVGATLLGRNGGGDRYYTDGELTIGVLARGPVSGRVAGPAGEPRPGPDQGPVVVGGPPADAVVAGTVSRTVPQGVPRPMSATFLEIILDRLAPLGEVTSRPLFGGHGLYWRGTIFGILFGDRLYLKVDDGPGPPSRPVAWGRSARMSGRP